MERMNTKLDRMAKEYDTIKAIRQENMMKRSYLDQVLHENPKLEKVFNLNPKQDLHSLGYSSLKYKYSNCVETARFQLAASMIQRNWRVSHVLRRVKEIYRRRSQAARVIQIKWKGYKFLRVIKGAILDRANQRCSLIQKYIRGYLAVKRTYEMRIETKMNSHFRYFDSIRNEMLFNSQIILAYHMKKFLKKKRAKEAAKKAKKEAEKNKYGRRFTKRSTKAV